MEHAVRNYLVVTASYWGFTLVDGALRMLVLLHFFKLGYSPFTLSFLFLLYEFAGIVANLAGGWLAVRFGIPAMLAVAIVKLVRMFFLFILLALPGVRKNLMDCQIGWIIMPARPATATTRPSASSPYGSSTFIRNIMIENTMTQRYTMEATV